MLSFRPSNGIFDAETESWAYEDVRHFDSLIEDFQLVLRSTRLSVTAHFVRPNIFCILGFLSENLSENIF